MPFAMHCRRRPAPAANLHALLCALLCTLPCAVLTTAVRPASAADSHARSLALALRQDRHGVTVEADGGPFASYVIDESNKPYLWPVIGPTLKPMTRAYPMRNLPDEPLTQRDHPHHRGITFGHESLAGSDSWHDRSTFDQSAPDQAPPGQAVVPTDPAVAERRRQQLALLGRIAHREFSLLALDADKAVIEEICDHLDAAGKPVLVEHRRLTFRAEKTRRMIDIDQDFLTPHNSGPVRVGDNKDAGLFVRVPTSMAVDSKQGGVIVNSDGLLDADAWSKPARWCDYHGPVAGEHLGIAILNHPTSHRHPTRWHVRTYGLFAANPFASRGYDAALPDAATTIAPGEVLRLRHRILLHVGDERAAAVDEAWRQYARETPAPLAATNEPATH
jgi:hypothetical protein